MVGRNDRTGEGPGGHSPVLQIESRGLVSRSFVQNWKWPTKLLRQFGSFQVVFSPLPPKRWAVV